jgi:trehalose-phosphatase
MVMTRPLFDATREIGAAIGRAPHLLLCLDFDGTLTPLVDDPADAHLAPHMERVLRALTQHERVSLALLSGRNRNELQGHVGMPDVIYAGNHGLEISGPGFVFIEPKAAAETEALKRLAAALAKDVESIDGALVEDKGLTLSVHYRLVDVERRGQVRRAVEAGLANAGHPFSMTQGDQAYEICPAMDWNKGNAVTRIKDQVGKPNVLLVYLGDDATDEDVFAAFPDGITVKVADTTDTAAHYRLEGPADVRRFLEWLHSRLSD